MKIARRSFASWFAAGGLAYVRFPAGAAEITLKYGNDVPTTHVMTQRVIQAAARIRDDTHGRVSIEVYPFSQLGGSTGMLQQVRLGAIDLLNTFDTLVETVVPAAGITGIPFAFQTHQDGWKAVDGPLSAPLQNALAGAGLYRFPRAWETGFRQVSNNVRPVNKPDDLRGIKLRLPNAAVLIGMFKALGASPAAMDANLVYTSLQTKVVDGLDVPFDFLETNKYYEVVKYASKTNHSWTAYALMANLSKWQALPADVRTVLSKRFDQAAIEEREEVAREDAAILAAMKGHGVIYNEADIGAFREAVKKAGLYQQWREHYGAEVWASLEKAVGKLA